MTLRFCLWILAILYSQPLWAGGEVRLVEWHSAQMQAAFILPVRNQETPSQALQRYLKSIERNSELLELFQGRLPYAGDAEFQEISPRDMREKALLIANLPKDYTLDSLRVTKFKEIFAEKNQVSFLLPIAANGGLSRGETAEFHRLLSEKFPFLVAMGGDDVDPAKYNKENLHSRNTVPSRDRYEIELIKSYTRAEKGFLLGVCRGSQISSVALGYELHQHVPLHIGKDIAHGNDWHDIRVFETRNNILKSLISQSDKLHVNSLHHQAVRFVEGGPLEVAARAGDGTIEALEFKNGRGILLQFHPELMNNQLGTKILHKILEKKDLVRGFGGSCRRIF